MSDSQSSPPDQSENVTTVRIDLDKLQEVAAVGVRRAALFMGLGLNAANRPDFNDYQLSKLPVVAGQTSVAIDFLPGDVPQGTVAMFKGEFATWITGCGMRELMEHYALMLDRLHNLALNILNWRNALNGMEPQREADRFSKRGVPDKLKRLRNLFGVSIAEESQVSALYEARNCLTHDLGFLKSDRCTNGLFRLEWRAFKFSLVGETTGTEYDMPVSLGVELPEPSRVKLSRVNRTREFPEKTKLVLTQQDLWEICLFVHADVVPHTIESFKAFLVANGVVMEAPPQRLET